MNSKLLDKKVSTLSIDKKIISILNDKEIYFIKELWPLSRCELKKLSLNDSQIKQIVIQLQLNGIDLNKRMYN